MRQTIVLQSRYRDRHRLDRIGQEDSCLYLFVPQDDWYRVGYKGDTDDKDYQFVDPSGGPFVEKGYKFDDDHIVKKVFKHEKGIAIEME